MAKLSGSPLGSTTSTVYVVVSSTCSLVYVATGFLLNQVCEMSRHTDAISTSSHDPPVGIEGNV